jgi:uncharacterized protein YaeQ
MVPPEAVALSSTIYTVEIDVSDADRRVYESLALRVARHPSESPEFLVTRLLAYALEFREGIAFSAGLSDPDEPALSVRDLTGAIESWIEVGTPDAARLHKASKASRRVAVYTHKDPAQFLGRLAGERIHRADALEIYAIDRALIGALANRLERRMTFSLARSEGDLYISIGEETLTGGVVRHRL